MKKPVGNARLKRVEKDMLDILVRLTAARTAAQQSSKVVRELAGRLSIAVDHLGQIASDMDEAD